MDTARRKTRVAWLSVGSNSALVVLKLAVGLAIGSVSVLSEAIHSAVDLVAAIIALVAVRVAAKPPDVTHPFGHGKVENASGTIEAALIFVAAGWIAYEAVRKLAHPVAIETLGLGMGIMALSAVVNLVVSALLFRVGTETDSLALIADGWHLRTDVYTSAGVMAALAAIWVGRAAGLDLGWLDPAIALGVAALIVRAAWRLTRRSSRDLFDARLPQQEEERIRACIERHVPTVHGYHHFRTRRAGNQWFVDFHLLVDAETSVEAAHQLTDSISQEIQALHTRTNVTIHVEPCGIVCTATCKAGCMVANPERGDGADVRADG